MKIRWERPQVLDTGSVGDALGDCMNGGTETATLAVRVPWFPHSVWMMDCPENSRTIRSMICEEVCAATGSRHLFVAGARTGDR